MMSRSKHACLSRYVTEMGCACVQVLPQHVWSNQCERNRRLLPVLPGAPVRWGLLKEEGGLFPGAAQAKATPEAE